ncbi:ABC transporter family substrate-binding protein [Streptomyces sp. ODS28]|uniref:ABC transporter family substrate-binding protein n=1 Tax=Streptomyces sp. ODS28 TaxID=3136688 RepID=UPI0031EBBBBB
MPVNATFQRRSPVLALVLAAGVMLPLAGCSSAPDDDEPASAGKAAQDAPEAARDRVAYGGTVRWAVDSAPKTYNTFQSEAGPVTDRIAGATLPSLFTLDEKARPQANPDYVESAEVTGTEPRQTVVYKLNPKARWSDGRPLGVADFKAQWKALNGKNRSYASARNDGYDRIRSITRGGGPHEVKVTFERPYADWQSLFTPLYPASATSSPQSFNTKSKGGLPTSAGPFEVQQPSSGARVKKDKGEKDTVVLVRNPAWWGDKAKLDRIELKPVPKAARTKALGAGKLDIAEVEASTLHRIDGAASQGTGTGGGKNGERGAPAGGAAEPADAQGTAPLQPAAASMRDWAEAHMAKRDVRRAVKEEKARQKAEREAARQRAAENRQLRGYTVDKALGTGYTQLALNGESGPLQDERVRRAVARAIDRPGIAEKVLGAVGLPAKPLGSHLRMPDQEGYSDNSAALGGEDVQAAQELLADSGWKGQSGAAVGGTDAKADGKPQAEAGKPAAEADGKSADGRNAGAEDTSGKVRGEQGGAEHKGAANAGTPVRTKDGQSLTLRFVVPEGQDHAEVRATGERISKALSGLGIRTKMIKAPDSAYFSDHIASGDYDLALYSWPSSAYPATDGRPLFAKPRPAADGSLMVEQNFTRVGTDQIDQLFDRAAGELDQENRDELIQRADARIWAAAGSVPLYQKPELVAAKDRLVNAGAFGFRTPRYQDIGYRKS